MNENCVLESDQLKEMDAGRGIFAKGTNLIEDHGQRSDWDQDKITRCIAQLSQRVRAHSLGRFPVESLNHGIFLYPDGIGKIEGLDHSGRIGSDGIVIADGGS
jgi:hypothetical protein